MRELSAKITAGCFSENANLQYQHKKEKKPQSQHIQDSPASVPSLRTALFWSSGPAASVKTPSSFTKQSYKEVFWTIKASRLSILWQYLAKQYIMYKTSHYSLVFHCTENLGITS